MQVEEYVIYLDVFFMSELLMNVLVLVIYCRISRKRYRKRNYLLSAAAASAAGVFCLLAACRLSWWNGGCSFAAVCLMAVFEILLLQLLENLTENNRKRISFRQSMLEMPALFFSAFLLAGILYLYLPAVPGIRLLIKAAAAGIIFIEVGITVIYWRRRGNGEEGRKEVWITFEGETYTVTAITDTGNNLYDPAEGQPVHIVEEKYILKEGQKEGLLKQEPEKLSFVPYSSLGNTAGVLMVLTAQRLVIREKGRKIELENQKIGLTEQKLNREGRWQMLLHPDLEACLERKGGRV
ncbi:MAG: sigma-E processing peptidase SpoIIGA [Lachnospiraceae bacterium]|nr:sigma-E processing peptidase SpoIIGA [Lachnospiraceae bacterium]